MTIGRSVAAGLMLLGVPLFAQAQDIAATPEVSVPGGLTRAAPPPVDPTRLAAARRTVDFIFPTGTYARIMGKSLQAMMGPMMDGVGAMPMRDLAALGGVKPEEVAKLGQGTLGEMMAVLDPAYRRRMEITVQAMTSEMSGLMTEIEPAMREGLAQAYARRFQVTQLADLNRFFTTPTGRAYAADSMVIYTDPEVIAQMQAFMPLMMKRMPAMMAKVQQSTAALPKPRTMDQLTPAEQAKLKQLMGVPEGDGDTPKS